MKLMPSLIADIKKISSVTNIPLNEIQSFNPPSLKIHNQPGNKEPSIITIWDGGANLEKSNADCFDKVKPTIHDIDAIDSIFKDESEHEGIWGTTQSKGIEAIAWYKSFHFSNYWGIYVSYAGLLRYASKLHKTLKNQDDALECAWNGLMAHESIHYAVDVACARIELLFNSPIYLPSQKSLFQQFGYSIEEERLAQSALLRYFKKIDGRYSRILGQFQYEGLYKAALMDSYSMPAGYSSGHELCAMKSFKFAADKYISDLVSLSALNVSNFGFDKIGLSYLMPLLEIRGGYIPGYIDRSECPIYIVNDCAKASLQNGVLSFISQITHIRKSNRFEKLVVPKYLDAWVKTAAKLADPGYKKNNPNLDFKPWPKEDNPQNNTRAWAVRVGGKTSNLRAHIDEHLIEGYWEADRFGDADKMGHHKNKK